MSNSSLVTYKHILTKHRSVGRGNKKIEKIFVHHMAGNLTVKQCGNVFDNREASAHYGVNGTAIGQYVDEKDTAWHCGNFSWNQRSIGIELANDGGSNTDWHVADKTIDTAIQLIADICRRNGIKAINYTGDLTGNLCMHKWVVSTSCPGPYLSTKFRFIAAEVNKIMSGEAAPSKLDEDGIGGPLTVSRMQEFLGTPIDGVISGQNKDLAKYYPALEAVNFDNEESTCVHALQWLVGVYEDGVIGPDTVKGLQRFLGVEEDGIWGPVTMEAWQKYLNEHEKAEFPETHVTTPPVTATPVVKESTNAQKIVNKAKSLAGDTKTPTKAYTNALNKCFPNRKKWGKLAREGKSCDVFVAVVLRSTGLDPDCPRGLKGQYTHVPPKDKFDRLVYKNVKPYDVSQTGDVVIYKNENATNPPGHACIRTKTGIYEANHSTEKYPHFTKGFSKLKTQRPQVIIYRAK